MYRQTRLSQDIWYYASRGKRLHQRDAGNLVFLVNESAVKYFGWDYPEGKELGYYNYEYTSATGYREVPVHGEVIGVIKDYHQADLKNKIQPMMISFNTNWLSNMAVKIEAGKISVGLAAVEQQWKKLLQTSRLTTNSWMSPSIDLIRRKKEQERSLLSFLP